MGNIETTWAVITVLLTCLGYIIKEFLQFSTRLKASKEEKYLRLLENVESFHASLGKNSSQDRKAFLCEFRKSYLYASDEVIKKGYKFINSISEYSVDSNELRNEKLSEFMLSMRKDMFSPAFYLFIRKTKLPAEYFKLIIDPSRK